MPTGLGLAALVYFWNGECRWVGVLRLPSKQRHSYKSLPRQARKWRLWWPRLIAKAVHDVPPVSFQALGPATNPMHPYCEVFLIQRNSFQRHCWDGFLPSKKVGRLAQGDGESKIRSLKKSRDDEWTASDHAIRGMSQAVLALGEAEKLPVSPKLSIKSTSF